ncbi:molybdopterin-guanine dinucleotide biosynthesis protein B [Brevibacillus ruminantium]|uniref:Molybdopterin-guanine dinucleotide biosynthesis protein B n=1 Tax=Brevibacillus ruminantium TaxID=2950604 RepID=A0ABY4WBM1_9BACL|nr:molybdopterin-guanine dinucleotide biosynthesis protein B [Brevibacillus ruminantium]USG64581.1 molybdopterin-guanine dinucleotide biosynthesis protein B [Brevibacillus ruminantium]
MAKQPVVLQLVGYSDSGKTTLLTRLIPGIEQAGIRVGIVKHDGGHDFEWDQPGKDTWKYREAGASLVAITSRTKTAMLEQRPLALSELIDRMAMAQADLVLVEGFKRESYPKLVLLRRPEDQELLSLVTAPVAIISWEAFAHPVLPVFSINDTDGILHFIRKYYEDGWGKGAR